jgi:thymidylate synthase
MIDFKNAEKAFDFYYNAIESNGVDFDGTKALFNIGFYINNPADNHIHTPYRNWNLDYAKAEWEWYLSGEPSLIALKRIYGKVPHIWQKMADMDGNVNSNYGYQWERGYQLDKVVQQLKDNPNTRKAAISIYDGKEINKYSKDTPCTYAVQFTVVNNKLNMCVTMRSNDLWFGFCNDQYCFSELMKVVAERTGYEIGSYFHFAHNLHLYERDLNKNGLLQRKANYYG